MTTTAWLAPPAGLLPSRTQVHVWRVDLEAPDAVVSRLRSSLSDVERNRADRFHFDRDRRHFTLAHGILRAILARYLRVNRTTLVFEAEVAGKPHLAPARPRPFLQFNLSHSRHLALVAITGGSEIGVDLEWVSDAVAVDQVAALIFSQSEIAVLDRLDIPRKREAFFNGWTRKEAIVKALGAGLGYPVRELTVSIAPGDPVCLKRADGGAMNWSRWTLEALSPAPGFSAAVAHRGPRRSLRLFEWSASLLGAQDVDNP
jgi:4'-phosphopantetheinyl transferase